MSNFVNAFTHIYRQCNICLKNSLLWLFENRKTEHSSETVNSAGDDSNSTHKQSETEIHDDKHTNDQCSGSRSSFHIIKDALSSHEYVSADGASICNSSSSSSGLSLRDLLLANLEWRCPCLECTESIREKHATKPSPCPPDVWKAACDVLRDIMIFDTSILVCILLSFFSYVKVLFHIVGLIQR